MHKVKCLYCGQEFDRDKEPAVKVNKNRYAHPQCAEEHEKNKTKEERDLDELNKYIAQLFNDTQIRTKIQKQIKNFKEKNNYTYSGILKTLIYWYEIKGNSTEKANGGIGIVEYVYSQALDYYYKLYLAQSVNREKDINLYRPKIKEIEIYPPQTRSKKVKLLFEDEE